MRRFDAELCARDSRLTARQLRATENHSPATVPDSRAGARDSSGRVPVAPLPGARPLSGGKAAGAVGRPSRWSVVDQFVSGLVVRLLRAKRWLISAISSSSPSPSPFWRA